MESSGRFDCFLVYELCNRWSSFTFNHVSRAVKELVLAFNHWDIASCARGHTSCF